MRINTKAFFLWLSFILLGSNIAYSQWLIEAYNVDAFVPRLTADTINVTLNDLSFYGDSLCVEAVYGSPLFSVANCSSVAFHGDSDVGKDSCWYIVCDIDTPSICDSAVLVVYVKANDSVLPLLETGKVWNICAWFAENPTCPITLSLGNDTLIGNYTYTRVIQNFGPNYDCYEYTGFDSIVGWIRQDTLKKVFFLQNNSGENGGTYCSPNDSIEYLLYDFGLQPGDTIYRDGHFNVVTSVNLITIDSIQREIWTFLFADECGPSANDTVIEGIGSNSGLLSEVWSTFENGYVLNCVTKDSINLYGDGLCNQCLNVGILNVNIHPMLLYPNPTTNFCNLQLPADNDIYTAAIFDVTGRQVQSLFNAQQISTYNFSTAILSSGMYFVKVTTPASSSNAGKTWVGKLVKE